MRKKKARLQSALKKRNLKIQDASRPDQELTEEQLNAVAGGAGIRIDPCFILPCIKTIEPCIKSAGIKSSNH